MCDTTYMKVTGTVQRGAGKGSELGYPTLNIPVPESVKDGVYVAETIAKGRKLPSVVAVGPAPAVGREERLLEVHLLDYSEQLYGEEIEVELLEYIRPIANFDTIKELQAAIGADVSAANIFFENR